MCFFMKILRERVGVPPRPGAGAQGPVGEPEGGAAAAAAAVTGPAHGTSGDPTAL